MRIGFLRSDEVGVNARELQTQQMILSSQLISNQ